MTIRELRDKLIEISSKIDDKEIELISDTGNYFKLQEVQDTPGNKNDSYFIFLIEEK